MAELNGGWSDYPDRVTKKIFFRADDRETKTVTIKSGQVIKALSFLESDSAGKMIAHSSLTASLVAGTKIGGVLLFDVDASAGDVEATAYVEASFWASALIWSVNIATDTITLFDGTTKAVTAYDTGCTTNLLKQKFVENSEFESLGFLSAGEQL